ncbi:DUF1772 domain-containing protein [Pseudaminobacter soli (ex Li et al. 2025)]|uniref:DUF1772 domain-containing protein n=1 Tax=Pseudaminobacter soli (ex Li et al. 2025) TaxID=1295366 RepID=A0A2P7SIM3_9HYPH|nr:anthrone oxygenase family protein [Mesorhizobium soli]PSJ62327.1 hypothetical protein C7I85_08490 [Mesorhizobium soli]
MIALFFLALTFLAALGSGLMAGLFFAFSTSVMAALAKLPAESGAAAMNAINVVILNPVFLSVFMGTTLACAILAVRAFLNWSEAGSAWLMAGSLSYLIGIFMVTAAFNVPLNDALAAVPPQTNEAATFWTRYLAEWVPWNHVRTMGGIAALASFIMALR